MMNKILMPFTYARMHFIITTITNAIDNTLLFFSDTIPPESNEQSSERELHTVIIHNYIQISEDLSKLVFVTQSMYFL